jgi:hypothetical protein
VVDGPEDGLLWAERAGPLRPAARTVSLVDHAVDQRPGQVSGTPSRFQAWRLPSVAGRLEAGHRAGHGVALRPGHGPPSNVRLIGVSAARPSRISGSAITCRGAIRYLLAMPFGAFARVSAHVARRGSVAHWEFSSTARVGSLTPRLTPPGPPGQATPCWRFGLFVLLTGARYLMP